MWIFNQVLSKVLSISYRVVFPVFLITLFVVFSVCLLAHCPYVSLGTVALWVNYRQVHYIFVCSYKYCKAHTSMTIFPCLPMRVGINLLVSLFDLW